MNDFLMDVFERLLAEYGPQRWWPSDGPFETIIGAILTQNTSWSNVAKALDNLRSVGAMSPAAIRVIPESQLAEIIRPSGYFNSKAKKLKAVVRYLEGYGDDTDAWLLREPKELRRELLGVYGIGPETADDIVLYVAGLPSFVMDTYTMRIIDRIGIQVGGKRYEDYQALFEDNLPLDPQLFNEYHALLDEHSKTVCHKRKPDCQKCPICDLCATGKMFHK